MTEPHKVTPTVAEEEVPKQHSLVDLLLMMFILIFFRPIMWLAERIRGGGVGFGPAFASFVGAAAIIAFGVILVGIGLLAVIGYLFLK